MSETKALGTKHLKFVSITEAITEIKNTLLMLSELKKREELEPLLRQLQDLQIERTQKKIIRFNFMHANQRKGFRILLKASLARVDTVLLFGVIPFTQQILLLWFRLTIRQSALYSMISLQ